MVSMTAHQLTQIEVAAALEALVRAFTRLTPNALNEAEQERLVLASSCDSDDLAGLLPAIQRTARVMKDMAYDCSGDIEDLRSIARKVQELGSVLHIARAYPDQALARAKAIGASFQTKTRLRRVPVPA